MAKKDLMEGLIAYQSDLLEEAAGKKSLLGENSATFEIETLKAIDEAQGKMSEALKKLAADTTVAEGKTEVLDQASYYQKTILADMDEVRKYADAAEALVPDSYLGYPTYGQMLFSLR